MKNFCRRARSFFVIQKFFVGRLNPIKFLVGRLDVFFLPVRIDDDFGNDNVIVFATAIATVLVFVVLNLDQQGVSFAVDRDNQFLAVVETTKSSSKFSSLLSIPNSSFHYALRIALSSQPCKM